MASYDVRFQAPLVSPATAVTAGQVMCETTPASGIVTIATAAALASAGRPLGVALISSNGIGSIDLQYTGPLLAPGYTLGAGAAGPVGIDPNGNLIRGVQTNGWNIGYCTTAGLVTLRDLSGAGSGFVNSPTGTGVVVTLSGNIVSAASLGAAYQTLQTNAAGTNVTWGPLQLGQAAAVTGVLPLANMASPTGNGVVLVASGVIQGAASVGTSGQLLLSGSSNAQWATMSGDASITSGGAVTVGSIHGATVPIAGSLTTGNILQVTGSSALGYAPVNLAGGANYVTGLLPVANIAAGTNTYVLTTTGGVTVWAAPAAAGITALTQDVTASGSGSVAATVTQAQAGAITFASGTGLIGFAGADTGPGLSQASTASATGAPLTFTAQQSTNASPTGGNIVNVLQGGSPTAEAYWQVKRGSTVYASIGAWPYITTQGGMYFGPGVVPGNTNYAFLSDGSSTQTFNVYASGTQYFTNGGSPIFGGVVTALATASGWQFGSSSASFGGGVGVLGIANATTQPSSAPSGGIVLAANSGILQVYDSASHTLALGGGGIQFGPAAAAASIAINVAASTTTGTASAVSLQGQGTSGVAGTAGSTSLLGGVATGTGSAIGGAAIVTGGAANAGGVGAVGGAVTITSGGSTSGTAGSITIGTGTGGAANGTITQQIAGTTVTQVTASGVLYAQPLGGSGTTPLSFVPTVAAISLGTSGTTTLSAAQAITPNLTITTGTLTGTVTLDFSTNGQTGTWFIDATGATPGTYGVAFKNGTQTQTLVTIPSGGLLIVRTSGSNRIAVN